MATLDRSVVIAAGGAGAIGEGIVAALLEAGAAVAVPSRDESRLDALRDRVGASDRLLGVVGNIADPNDTTRLRDEIVESLGPPDAVVAAVGGWRSGPKISELPAAEWDDVFANNVRTHQVIAAAYVPLLRGRPGATYAVVNGDAAIRPMAGAGPACAAAAAELMAARVLGEEEKDSGVQVLALVLGPVITRSRPKGRPEWITSHDVGVLLAREIAARSGVNTAQPTRVLDLPNRAGLATITQT